MWKGMRHDKEVNRAVLVSVETFDPGVQLSRRPGAGRDTKRLHRVLRKLGFKVDIHSDLTAREIYALFQKESKKTVEGCFLAVLSTHGEEGCVFGADGGPVRLSRIFSYFNNPHMEGKTKMFFIQACRGHELDAGVEVETDAAGSEDTKDTFAQYQSIPIDTAVMYATVPGYAAFSHPLGAVFLQTLCDLLEEEGGRGLELTRLTTRLSHRVAFRFQAKGRHLAGKKEMPCLVSRLTRDVFPFAEPGKECEEKGLSTTSLVSTDNIRPRKHSIS
ncbi:caspase-7 [Osmerus mordax]|uniref:caspase-7 n=1 Tax=Osmerus mordax TaxID=8014 RepID=UPI0035106E22